ncbi:hypothetical protein HGM15179_002493 [Zosterops borbonicus]|uniref:Uncharacterized protein n=1 Tax=Zosterops borbonicus TaxID=364589 RepID=A0A8K1GSR0_9PASS|nr:hypothetical protein HGM15179_002493 [Zosterops borbonicus]
MSCLQPWVLTYLKGFLYLEGQEDLANIASGPTQVPPTTLAPAYLPTQFYEEDKGLKRNENENVYYSQIPFDVQDRSKI